jgi:excisionase family DNA binding protein
MANVAKACESAGELTTVDESGSGLYSVRQVADQLGVHPETVRRLIHDGRLDAVRIGQRGQHRRMRRVARSRETPGG